MPCCPTEDMLEDLDPQISFLLKHSFSKNCGRTVSEWAVQTALVQMGTPRDVSSDGTCFSPNSCQESLQRLHWLGCQDSVYSSLTEVRGALEDFSGASRSPRRSSAKLLWHGHYYEAVALLFTATPSVFFLLVQPEPRLLSGKMIKE